MAVRTPVAFVAVVAVVVAVATIATVTAAVSVISVTAVTAAVSVISATAVTAAVSLGGRVMMAAVPAATGVRRGRLSLKQTDGGQRRDDESFPAGLAHGGYSSRPRALRLTHGPRDYSSGELRLHAIPRPFLTRRA
jgi:hypothetical protein